MRQIRLVTVDDEPAVRALLIELGYAQTDTLKKRLALWTADPNRHLLAAEDGGSVVGLVAVSVSPRLEVDGWWAQVVALVVSADARGQGIASRLLARAEETAQAAGCNMMLINSSRSREPAQALYLGAGYRDRSSDHAQFVRNLSPEAEG